MRFHPETLTLAQKRVLKRLGPFTSRQGFYLGGGTALALYLGHRRSKDFDWFTASRIPDALSLAASIREEGLPFLTGNVEKGTLNGSISKVRVSFFEYQYPLLRKEIGWPEFGCRLASLPDIACMKLSALAQRGQKKDFVDLYALGTKTFPLGEMLTYYQKKFDVKDIGHVLYALAYYDDAEKDKMPVMLWSVDWKFIKSTIQTWVKSFSGFRK